MSDYSIKAIRQEFKEKGIFYTPKETAFFLQSFIDIEYKTVYDPTCGHGNLLQIFDDNIEKYGQDINEIAVDNAQNIANSTIFLGDTLSNDCFKNIQFDVCIANPPFSIKYVQDDNIKNDKRFTVAPCLPPPSKADFLFILHCLAKIKEDGIAIILNFPGVLYRANKEKTIRKWLVDNNYIDKVVAIPPNKFTDTPIATALLVLKKNKTTTDVTFINEIEKKNSENITLTRVVAIDEIIENDYCLSVNTFIDEKEEKEDIDINALTDELENLALSNFKQQLIYDKYTYEFAKKDYSKYLDKYISIINSLRL